MTVLESLKAELIKAVAHLKSDKKEDKFEEYSYSPEQLNISEYKVGGKVEVIAADGSLSVAPDGDYTLSDGKKFTVKDGVIASIEEEQPEEMAEDGNEGEGEEKPTIEEVAAQVQSLQEEVSGLKQILEQVIEQITGVASQEEMSKFSSDVKKLTATIEKLAKIPSEGSKTNSSNKAKDKRDEQMMDFIKCFKAK